MLRMTSARSAVRRSVRAARRAGGITAPQRAFSSSPPPEKPHWSGVSTYYMSMRGLGIATRVVTSMPDFFRFYEGDAFAKHINDDARSAMFVLTQFPRATRVDLLEFRQAAEQLVHTVYEQMYATHSSAGKTAVNAGAAEQLGAPDATPTRSIEDPLAYLSAITSDAKSAAILANKAALQAKSLASGSSKRVILEQLSVNRVAIAAVDYKSVRFSDEEIAKRGYDEDEWLEIQVQYDVTEHLQLLSVGGSGIDDRKTVNTTFAWTFESNVTLPDQVEWQIIDATPFKEKSALLTAAAEDSKTK